MAETVAKKHKVCTKCKLVRPCDGFGKRKALADGLRGQCKQCDREEGIRRRQTKHGLIVTIYNNQVGHSRYRNDPSPEYTMQELNAWLMANPRFHKLYDLWVISGFDTNITPSCDRLDDYKGYSLDRLQVIKWNENRKKGDSDRVQGKNTKQSKPVVQLDMNLTVINKFHSLASAARETGLHQSNISKCCSGVSNQTGGYKWSFLNKYQEKLSA